VQQELVGVGEHRVAAAAVDGDEVDPQRDRADQDGRAGKRQRRRAHPAAAGEPRAGQDAGRKNERRDGVGRVHQRDRDEGRGGRGRGPADAADLEQEQDQHRRRQHPDRERRRLVDLDHEPVQQRAQVPGDEDGGQQADPAPAGERLAEGVGGHDREAGAERLHVAERRHRVDAGEPGHRRQRGVHDREGVAGVCGAVQERRDAPERDRRDVLELAHQADVEEAVADHGQRQPPAQVGEGDDADRPGGGLPQARRGQRRRAADGDDERGDLTRHRGDHEPERQPDQVGEGERRPPCHEPERRRDRRRPRPAQLALELERPQRQPARQHEDEGEREPRRDRVESQPAGEEEAGGHGGDGGQLEPARMHGGHANQATLALGDGCGDRYRPPPIAFRLSLRAAVGGAARFHHERTE